MSVVSNVKATENNSNINENSKEAKNALCNWLVSCFEADASSEISKTQLYPFYMQSAKNNKWTILTIPTFFEILK